MTSEPPGRRRRARSVLVALCVVMLAVIAVETFLLRQQAIVSAAARSEMDRLLGTFLLGDTTQASSGASVFIRMQNVRFKWSDRVYIDATNMAVRAAPLSGATVNFDNLDSFSLNVQQSVVLIRPDVLAGMFNESVFNYPGSRVRDLKVEMVKEDGRAGWMVKMDGRVNLVAWIPFTLFTHLSVDTATNTLAIDVDHLKVFGVLPVTKIIRWTPLNLDRMIALAPNRSLMVAGNRIMVKPFGLFPPPRINGRMKGVDVGADAIRITFAGGEIPAPSSSARNYVYLRGGSSRFGHFRMVDTNVLILDRDPSNPFVFSLVGYAAMIPKSVIALVDSSSVRITMPDS